jgi:thiol-disulfide isomerase/thioredoxin
MRFFFVLISMTAKRLLQLIIALFFLLSGVSKLFPIEPFELLLYQKGFPWAVSSYLARIIIIIEGLLFVGLLWPTSSAISKKTTLAAVAFLIFASIYLFWGIFSGSSQEDCGCFGTWMSMNHYWALIRNATLVLLLFFILKNSNTIHNTSNKSRLIFGIGGLTLAAVVLVVNPPDQWAGYQKAEINLSNGFPFEALPNPINQNGDTLNWVASEKQIIAFMTPGCPHCKKATMKLDVLSNKTGGKLPISIIFMGHSRAIPEFWEETGAKPFPHTFMDAESFLNISGSKLPAIFILENGEIIAKHLYRDFNPDFYLRD